ncbi:MAG: hypothetical protein LQ347_005570 [Umbilicaria vellea]|nr:MAG: hypothetical protein LQ347_005570 [Umbilicaria vellea]
MQMNSLQYNKKNDDVYNTLLSEYHDFTDIFQKVKKQSLSVKDLSNYSQQIRAYYDETENDQFKKYENNYYNNDQFEQEDD